jgi:hypothetical protein
MGTATSASVFTKSFDVTNPNMNNVTAKDRKKKSDNGFLSILASVSGTVLPVAQQSPNLNVQPKKVKSDVGIGFEKQVPAQSPFGSVILRPLLGQKTGYFDKPLNKTGNEGTQKAATSASDDGNGEAFVNLPNAMTDVDTAVIHRMKQTLQKPIVSGHTQISSDLQTTLPTSDSNAAQPKIQDPQIARLLNQSVAKAPDSTGDKNSAFYFAPGGIPKGGKTSVTLPDRSHGLVANMVADDSKVISSTIKKESPGTDSRSVSLAGINIAQPAASHVSHLQPLYNQQSDSHVNTLDVRQPTWMTNFGQIVGQVNADNGGTIQVKVHPEGMGDLLISVSPSTGGLQIQVEANQLSTVQWLGQQTAQLANAVSQLGISVANVQVGFGQANLSQSGNRQSNRKSADNETQVQTVTGPSESSSLLSEQSALIENRSIYSRGSSVTFRV